MDYKTGKLPSRCFMELVRRLRINRMSFIIKLCRNQNTRKTSTSCFERAGDHLTSLADITVIFINYLIFDHIFIRNVFGNFGQLQNGFSLYDLFRNNGRFGTRPSLCYSSIQNNGVTNKIIKRRTYFHYIQILYGNRLFKGKLKLIKILYDTRKKYLVIK